MIIIPLGEECYTCQSIDPKFSNNHIRVCAFPFDYVAGTQISMIYNNLYNLFINKEEPLIESDITTIAVTHIDGKYYFNRAKYGFIYWHDIGNIDNNFSTDDKQNFINKYNRRYESLMNTIKTSDSIIFFCTSIGISNKTGPGLPVVAI